MTTRRVGVDQALSNLALSEKVLRDVKETSPDADALYWAWRFPSIEMRVLTARPLLSRPLAQSGRMIRQQPTIEGQNLPMTPPGPLVAAGSSRRRIVISAAGLMLLALCALGFYLRRDTFARSEGSTVRLARPGENQRGSDCSRALVAGLARFSRSSLPQGAARVELSNLCGRGGIDSRHRAWIFGAANGQAEGFAAFARGPEISKPNGCCGHASMQRKEPIRRWRRPWSRLYMGSFRLRDATSVLERWMRQRRRRMRARTCFKPKSICAVEASTEVIIDRYQQALRARWSLNQARLGLAKQLHISRRFSDAAADMPRILPVSQKIRWATWRRPERPRDG